jgi:hypothetical protein
MFNPAIDSTATGLRSHCSKGRRCRDERPCQVQSHCDPKENWSVGPVLNHRADEGYGRCWIDTAGLRHGGLLFPERRQYRSSGGSPFKLRPTGDIASLYPLSNTLVTTHHTGLLPLTSGSLDRTRGIVTDVVNCSTMQPVKRLAVRVMHLQGHGRVYGRVWRMLGQDGCTLQTVLGLLCAPESLESLAT